MAARDSQTVNNLFEIVGHCRFGGVVDHHVLEKVYCTRDEAEALAGKEKAGRPDTHLVQWVVTARKVDLVRYPAGVKCEAA